MGWLTALILNGCNGKSYGIGHLAALQCFVGSHSRVAKFVYLSLLLHWALQKSSKGEMNKKDWKVSPVVSGSII